MELSKAVFDGYESKKINLQQLKIFISNVKSDLPKEVRNEIERKLTQLNLTEILYRD